MSKIEIIKLPDPRFYVYSLDDFIRHQAVSECWRNIDGEWKLLPIAFTEDWGPEKRREEAAGIIDRINRDLIAFAAVENDQIAGYITVVTKRIGSRKQYVQLEAFQVSEPYRGRGIGKQLFTNACENAKEIGAEKLYISAHSSRESQAAYKALGCVHAQEIIQCIADKEPCDVQLEYVL